MVEDQLEEKTELPTERRLERLREEGKLYRSMELARTATLLSFIVFGVALVPELALLLIGFMRTILSGAFWNEPMDRIITMVSGSLAPIGALFLLLCGGPMLIGVLTVLIQTNFNVRAQILKFEVGELSPGHNLAQIFSLRQLTELGIGILKVASIGGVSFILLYRNFPELCRLTIAMPQGFLSITGVAVSGALSIAIGGICCFSALEFFRGRNAWIKENRMSKREIKEELRMQEGRGSITRIARARQRNTGGRIRL